VSGLARNLFTLIFALLARGRFDAQSRVACHFLITPFDCGTSVLKSDKYLQLVESAQLDFLVKTKLIGKLVRNRIHFVNASQLVKFMRPISMFSRVRVVTSIIYADDKCAYFSHSFFLQDQQHGEVLVKMKFKRGAATVSPTEVAGNLPSVKHEYLKAWDQTLEAMRPVLSRQSEA
jgi:acyl-CoA thioesterase FadM